MTTPAPTISSELKTVLRAVKLGKCLDTLPERLALARSNRLPHHDFLEMLLTDEGTVNLRSCGRSANHKSLIGHTRPGESRTRTGENRPRIAQVDAMKGRGLRSS